MTTPPLPLNVVIMAGGQGQRLRPLTNDTPKPMLTVGQKNILERLVKHITSFGLSRITISIGYLGEKIQHFFGDGSQWNAQISYLKESVPMGSIGMISQREDWPHEYFLVINGDLLTNFDIEHFFAVFHQMKADMAVATYEYKVEIPWGILKVDDSQSILEIREKPIISRQINAGIYLFKKQLLSLFPHGMSYEGWQLLKDAIAQEYMVKAIPIKGDWMDIGNISDFEKAQTLILAPYLK